ncbi:MAG: alpha-ketoacid dehydrogenase subunit beta, partial [Cyclobacteriaceae bacterium]|nr:alpha-ketoacid dehydrogenase subunit beta [Cyclobacteriaceae bacterium]
MRVIQFREALREAMSEEMRRDPRVFLMGEEVAEYNGAYKVSQGMLDEFGPERVIDTPISELGFAGLGVGAAMNGLRPIIEFMTFNFSLVAIDQVINSAAKMYSMSGGQYNVPIVFRGPTGNAGQLAAQHSQNFENWYANCPGLKVVVPSTPYDAKGLLKTAIRDEGISAEVIDLRSVRPIDYAAVVESVKKTNRLVIVEEAWPLASISSEITYHIQKHAFDYLDAPVHRITSADAPLPYAPTLIQAILPNVERTVKAVKAVMYR